MKAATGAREAVMLPGLAEAQHLLAAHLASDAAGRCLACGQIAPCHPRNLAHAAFARAGQLPQRQRRHHAAPADPDGPSPEPALAVAGGTRVP